MENNKIRVIELFGGIGAVHQSLKNLDKEFVVVDMVEHNKTAVKAYNKLHYTSFEPQDILTWDKKIKCDYLHASPPCVSFSSQGKQLGANDEKNGSILWDAMFRIIERTKPKMISIENVKGILSAKNKDFYIEVITKLMKLGYTTETVNLNAKDFGIPQNRERIFICAYNTKGNFNKLYDKTNITLRDFGINIEDSTYCETTRKEARTGFSFWWFENKLKQYNGSVIEFDNSVYDKRLDEANKFKINRIGTLKDVKFNSAKGFHSIDGLVKCLRASSDNRHEAKLMDISFNSDKSFNSLDGISGTLLSTSPDFKQKIMDCNKKFSFIYRKLTSKEVLELMGFKDWDFFSLIDDEISEPQICKLAGNSIVVPVMEFVIQSLWGTYE